MTRDLSQWCPSIADFHLLKGCQKTPRSLPVLVLTIAVAEMMTVHRAGNVCLFSHLLFDTKFRFPYTQSVSEFLGEYQRRFGGL